VALLCRCCSCTDKSTICGGDPKRNSDGNGNGNGNGKPRQLRESRGTLAPELAAKAFVGVRRQRRRRAGRPPR